MVDDRRHVLDTQIVRPGTGQSHVVDDVFSFFIIEIRRYCKTRSLPVYSFLLFQNFFCSVFIVISCNYSEPCKTAFCECLHSGR